MTAAATILAVLLIAAVIYILVQAELHHEDAGTIRKQRAELDDADLVAKQASEHIKDLRARQVVMALDLRQTRNARDKAEGAARIYKAMLDEEPLAFGSAAASLLAEVEPIHDGVVLDLFGGAR